MAINNWITINKTGIRTGTQLLPPLDTTAALTPEALYHALQCNYPKFYKMDNLCKWAFVATDCLFYKNNLNSNIDKNKVAVALSTSHGCIDVDKRYQAGITIPSPALFVYTLPNIMLGEICIRHGINGEQHCMVTESFDADELFFTANGLLSRSMDACLCGWVDVAGDSYDVCLFWISNGGTGVAFTAQHLLEIYKLR